MCIRDSLLAPLTASDVIHAVVLSGGSAFGLEAGCGVADVYKRQAMKSLSNREGGGVRKKL